MRNHLSPRKKLSLYILVFSLILLVILARLTTEDSDQERFESVCQELFFSDMTSNTLNMHYTLADPSKFGIAEYEPVLPIYQGLSDQSTSAESNDYLAMLNAMKTKHFSPEDNYCYTLLSKKLENATNLKSQPYFDDPLSPTNGMQSQLPILLAEYAFRSERDVDDYLKLLEQTGAYFDSLLQYEKEKTAAGLAQSAQSMAAAREQCDTIVTKNALETHTHFLQTSFEERLTDLVRSGILKPAQIDAYLSANDRLLQTVLLPAYERMSDTLFILMDRKNVPALPQGLSAYPCGKEYYQALLISQTGSYRSIDDIQELLLQNLHDECVVSGNALTKNSLNQDLPFRDASAMLSDLQTRMKNDFPALTPDSPTPMVKTVSENLQDFCAPAFYLTVPVDDTDNNVIYINHRNEPSPIELYTTLAHEGFPGHLYQTVYHNRLASQKEENPVRHLLWYGGYLEGWALYVEFYSYDYLKDILTEQGRSEEIPALEATLHNRKLLLSLYSILDLKIHYENASREDIADYLAAYGVTNRTAIDSVYNYIADSPCNYLKYYLGYLEILDLKEQAKELWGEEYTDYKFHQFFLDCGPSDFETLHRTLLQEPLH